jgi:hypothetical protein
MEVARLVLRQDSGPETLPSDGVTCKGDNSYDGRMGVRISAIFVILIGSTFGKSAPDITIGSSPCTNRNRCRLPSLCKTTTVRPRAFMGLLHRKVLRLRCHRSHSIHPPARARERGTDQRMPNGRHLQVPLGRRYRSDDHLRHVLP